MKKFIIGILSILLLTGCSYIEPYLNKEETNETNKIEELGEKFEYSEAQVLATLTKATFVKLDRGTEIEIINEDDDFYYFNYYCFTLAIDKDFVRTENEEPYEEWNGYTVSKASFYDSYDCSNETKTFALNDQVKVIDEVNDILLVEYEEQQGYMYSSEVRKNKIVIVKKVETPVEVDTGSYSGGGSSGGGSSEPSYSSGDGQDIVTSGLSFTDYAYVDILLDNTNAIKGTVLLDDTIAYISFFGRDDTVKVVEVNDEEAVVLVNGFKATVDRDMLMLAEDEPYEEWVGYAYGGAVIYTDYDLTEEREYCSRNDELKIVGEINDILIVSLEDGSIGYMDKDDVSENKIVVRVTTKVVEETPAYSGGGDSGGSSGGGSTPAPEPEWTDNFY